MRRVALLVAVLLVCVCVSFAQDPVKVDAKHYTVVSENAQVRILRAHYGAHEKSVMHEHPDTVAVFLSDAHVKFTMPDGTSVDASGKAGDSRFSPAGKHNPENVGDKPFDVIVIELKGKPASHPAAHAKAPAKKKT